MTDQDGSQCSTTSGGSNLTPGRFGVLAQPLGVNDASIAHKVTDDSKGLSGRVLVISENDGAYQISQEFDQGSNAQPITATQLARDLEFFVKTQMGERKSGIGSKNADGGVDDTGKVWSTDAMDGIGWGPAKETGTLASRLEMVAQALNQQRGANDPPIWLYVSSKGEAATTDQIYRKWDSCFGSELRENHLPDPYAVASQASAAYPPPGDDSSLPVAGRISGAHTAVDGTPNTALLAPGSRSRTSHWKKKAIGLIEGLKARSRRARHPGSGP